MTWSGGAWHRSFSIATQASSSSLSDRYELPAYRWFLPLSACSPMARCVWCTRVCCSVLHPLPWICRPLALRTGLRAGSLLRICASGTWWAESSAADAAQLICARLAGPTGRAAAAISADRLFAGGRLWPALTHPGQRPSHALYPALADAAALQALLLAVDAQYDLQVEPDGTALVRLSGQEFHLSPLTSLQSALSQKAGQALWLNSTAQSQLLLRVGKGERWAQAMVVSLAQ